MATESHLGGMVDKGDTDGSGARKGPAVTVTLTCQPKTMLWGSGDKRLRFCF